ncbi:NADP-dependent oxidoreductase domain-containing protein [Amylocystis lapponica]|nr:NADP-dependent oxidoreductase domain-containing protein [Amylocystis lapponica]
MVVPLGSVQPVFSLPPLDSIPDDSEDVPEPGLHLGEIGPLHLPEIVFGAASFSSFYNGNDHLAGPTPIRTVRLALRYGIRAFDTSPYYGVSEIVLGTALKAVELEFPRSSYKLMTKCGRYGPAPADCDYSPATIRASVQRSLARLNTTYLDAVYLHDVELVSAPVGTGVAGNHTVALAAGKAEYGLDAAQEGKVLGTGDQQILDALAELRKMQAEGLVKAVGITGYPLPTLLRLALLALQTPPHTPLDVLLSYSHLTLQNDAFAAFAPLLRERARVPQLLAASPLSMGLLTPSTPAWHPASPELRAAGLRANAVCAEEGWEEGLPSLAVGYGYRHAEKLDVPMVVGLSNLREVHENVRAWRAIKEKRDEAKRVGCEEKVAASFGDLKNWSWASP